MYLYYAFILVRECSELHTMFVANKSFNTVDKKVENRFIAETHYTFKANHKLKIPRSITKIYIACKIPFDGRRHMATYMATLCNKYHTDDDLMPRLFFVCEAHHHVSSTSQQQHNFKGIFEKHSCHRYSYYPSSLV